MDPLPQSPRTPWRSIGTVVAVAVLGVVVYQFGPFSGGSLSGSVIPPTGICGDRIRTGMEQCDDGNIVGGDGCSVTCMLEAPVPGSAAASPSNSAAFSAGLPVPASAGGAPPPAAPTTIKAMVIVTPALPAGESGPEFTLNINNKSFPTAIFGQTFSDSIVGNQATSAVSGIPEYDFVVKSIKLQGPGELQALYQPGGKIPDNVFVKNIPPGATTTIIYELQKAPGAILKVKVVSDPPTADVLFRLDGDIEGSIAHGQESQVEVGIGVTYDVGVGQPNAQGWIVGLVTCDDAGRNTFFDSPNASISFNLAKNLNELPGKTITCTVTFQRAPIIEVDVVTDTNPPTLGTLFTFEGDIVGSIEHGKKLQLQVFEDRLYSVKQKPKPGWTLTSITCDQPALAAMETREAGFDMHVADMKGKIIKCVFKNKKQ